MVGINPTMPPAGLNPETPASEQAKFGEVWKKIQAEMGARPDKPREAKKTLGKDDFLRIMITQMQHQDPTKPFDADKMAQDMAQITSVEQLQNMNQTLHKISTQERPLEKLAMTHLIGKQVQIDKNRFIHSKGVPEALSFNLAADAAEVVAMIENERGEVVYDVALGAQKKGSVAFNWDGIKKNTVPAENGQYRLRIAAVSGEGRPIEAKSSGNATIIGIGFDGTQPSFIVQENGKQMRVALENIVQIEDGSSTGLPQKTGVQSPGSAEPPSVQPQAGKPNFFTFEKGVGSKTISSLDTPGFPNGLGEAQPTMQKGGNQK